MGCYSLKRSTKRSNAGGARESQGRALAGLLLSNQILKQLMGQCLMGHPRADLGGLFPQVVVTVRTLRSTT